MSAILKPSYTEAVAQFDTVEHALRFAFNQNRENYQASIINRMAGTPGSEGRGLGGLEGAGMAGIICRQVKALGFVPEAILMARYAQREERCAHCLNGTRATEFWCEAVAEVATHSAAALNMSHYRLRYWVARRQFGCKLPVTIAELALQVSMSQRTCEEHIAKVKQWIGKQEGAAIHAISINLREAGIVLNAD